MKIQTDTKKERGQRQTLPRGHARNPHMEDLQDSPTATLMML